MRARQPHASAALPLGAASFGQMMGVPESAAQLPRAVPPAAPQRGANALPADVLERTLCFLDSTAMRAAERVASVWRDAATRESVCRYRFGSPVQRLGPPPGYRMPPWPQEFASLRYLEKEWREAKGLKERLRAGLGAAPCTLCSAMLALGFLPDGEHLISFDGSSLQTMPLASAPRLFGGWADAFGSAALYSKAHFSAPLLVLPRRRHAFETDPGYDLLQLSAGADVAAATLIKRFDPPQYDTTLLDVGQAPGSGRIVFVLENGSIWGTSELRDGEAHTVTRAQAASSGVAGAGVASLLATVPRTTPRGAACRSACFNRAADRLFVSDGEHITLYALEPDFRQAWQCDYKRLLNLAGALPMAHRALAGMHMFGVTAVACSGDAALVACGDSFGGVSLWDGASQFLGRAVLAQSQQHPRPWEHAVTSIDISPDGQLIAAGYFHGVVGVTNRTWGEVLPVGAPAQAEVPLGAELPDLGEEPDRALLMNLMAVKFGPHRDILLCSSAYAGSLLYRL